jgi:hypothetical protein
MPTMILGLCSNVFGFILALKGQVSNGLLFLILGSVLMCLAEIEDIAKKMNKK